MLGSLLHSVLEYGDFLNDNVSHGSVATCLRFGGIFNFTVSRPFNKRILKIG